MSKNGITLLLQGDIRTIFRPFNMNAMEDVSILFADIVGFTKMSSNKARAAYSHPRRKEFSNLLE